MLAVVSSQYSSLNLLWALGDVLAYSLNLRASYGYPSSGRYLLAPYMDPWAGHLIETAC